MDIEILRNIPLFAKFSDAELTDLSTLLKTVPVERNQPVFWVGDEGTEFYIVQTGEVALTVPDVDGKDKVIAVLKAGDFFGEISLLDGGPRTATARCVSEQLQLLSLSRAEFHQFLRQRPTAAIHILTVLGHRQREMLDKLRGVQNANLAIEEKATAWQRIADVIAAVSASQAFVLTHVLLFAGWMLVNKFLGDRSFDPYPYNLLTMTVSLEAIFLSIFVLISQNRSGEKDRIRADLDYQVNLKAHLEIMNLHHKLDVLRKEVAETRGAADDGATVTR
jgi:CRP/FNR family cyclic AMP-dependent transcriptional regulator